VPGTLHAVEHVAIGLLPLFTICDRWDVGGVSTPLQAETGLPTIVIYDGYPGGAGIAELGYASADRHLQAARGHRRLPVHRRCPRACSRPSAATATSRSTSTARVAAADLLAAADRAVIPDA
jgi:DEAD/DEAH box helicase domain-containing protein